MYVKCKCPVFMNIKQNLHYKVAIELNINREMFIFYVLLPISSLDKVGAGYIRQVVVLNNNNCMGIGLGGLSIAYLRQVVVL